MIRKREKIAELKLAIKQEEEKQKKVTGRSRVLREQQTSVVEVLEAKESKPVIFRALLGKRQQRMDDKKDDSFKKSKLRHQTKSEKRLLQDLEALHAQSCLLMLPNMIRGKVVAVTKQTEASEKDIVRLKAMLEKVNASKGGSFGSHTVSKPSNKMSQVMTGP